jgi:GNAT superfamily N-acetyltransferase
VNIQTVTLGTFENILPLIADYQRFYESQPDGERNRRFYSQFIGDHRGAIQFLALDDKGVAIGFATLYFPYSSISAGVTCLMNDLFVLPEARGKGVGRALIAHCREHAKGLGFPRIHWHTFESNKTAHRLYDETGAFYISSRMYFLSV